MININFEDKTYTIKNQVSELLIKDFEHICSILNDKEKNKIDKWSEIFIYLGLPEEVVDEFDSFAFINIIKEFNLIDVEGEDFAKEIILDDKTYIAYEDKFKLTVKEMSLIEYYVQKNENRYLGEMMAIIYKHPDYDKTINFDKAHIHFKAELIRKQITTNKAIPFITFLSKRLIKDNE
jgi:hypothetical protein